jgi:uncharacterized membrane protein affecting hemolysin expression
MANGNVDLDIDRKGLHVHFTNTPRWAYILIAIGIMFALIIGAHALYRNARADIVQKLAKTLATGKALTDKDAAELKALSLAEKHSLAKQVDKLILGQEVE